MELSQGKRAATFKRAGEPTIDHSDESRCVCA